MSGNDDTPARTARAERLAAALRANLRKRKAVGSTIDPERSQHPEPKPDQD
ncbi:hypothetical protein [Sandarakinorhabdus rubra]|uniref:hypothetical protein n=1 Tax=Sandarakinorhabdus rubra TaxID=2672568 RepID=UPI0013D98D94|nr:hypothetical protein [Sandarakinorhabdus rubra]